MQKRKIGIITGASGGLGEEFVKALLQENLDELWCIARNEAKLDAIMLRYGEKIRVFPKDLSLNSSIDDLESVLKEECPDVKFLINNAGIARMGRSDEFDRKEVMMYVDLNVKSVVLLTLIVLPFMGNGSHIINMSSQSSFQPLPYINLYASGKAFVRSYSRSLNRELDGTGIVVTACCPGWVDTNMLPKEYNGVSIKFPALAAPAKVVAKAMKDAKRGRDMSVYSFYVKYLHVLAKLLPQKLTMDFWLASIKKYVR
ncbi:MAG: SDR family NAD(P)-dependent oxidoreductase [Christensenellaceae bacterium]|nr:SDR family NAD(P)-dependent oxidoreductase [Christensenellaceae bacterium]